jgi:hypothetical protein
MRVDGERGPSRVKGEAYAARHWRMRTGRPVEKIERRRERDLRRGSRSKERCRGCRQRATGRTAPIAAVGVG